MPVSSQTKPLEPNTLKTELNLLLKTPQRSRTRRLIFTIHRWVGAVVGLYLLLMSMTGVSLVFHDELSAWLCPSPVITFKSERMPLSQIIENSEKAYPLYKVTGLIMSHEKAHPMDVFMANQTDKKINLEVDPYTGRVLGVKKESEVLKFLQELHFNLLNGKTGRLVNGIGASCLFTLAVTGVVVWWRGVINWLAGFKIPLTGSLKRINSNLHSALGAWVLPMLLVWSISGFSFAFPEFFEQNLNMFFPVSSQKKLPEPDDATDGTASPPASGELLTSPPASAKLLTSRTASPELPTVDRLVETAQASSKEKSFVERIAFPDKRRKSVRIWLSDEETTDVNAPRTQVFLNPASGKVLAVSTSEHPPTGDLIIQWLIRFHFGTFLGTISKSAWLVVGLAPATLAVTGLFLFAHGIAYRKEKKEESRISEETQSG
jgi:uncharacterized iron-regulated membrane protein